MEAILTSLLNFGIGGAMAAANLYVLYYTLTKTIPDLTAKFEAQIKEERLACHQDHTAMRADFVDLREQLKVHHTEVMARLES